MKTFHNLLHFRPVFKICTSYLVIARNVKIVVKNKQNSFENIRTRLANFRELFESSADQSSGTERKKIFVLFANETYFETISKGLKCFFTVYCKM